MRQVIKGCKEEEKKEKGKERKKGGERRVRYQHKMRSSDRSKDGKER